MSTGITIVRHRIGLAAAGLVFLLAACAPAAAQGPAAGPAGPAALTPVQVPAAPAGAAVAVTPAAPGAPAAMPPPPPRPAGEAIPVVEVPAASAPGAGIERVLLSTGTVNGATQQVISLTLDDVPLAEVVKLFTRVSGANIIAATSNLTGQVTASLQDVEWRPAFESILDRQGLLLTEKPPASGIFVIDTRRTSEDPHISETVPLSYAKVDDVTKLAQNVLGKDGTVTPVSFGNAIVVNASALRLAEIRKIVESVDRPRTQVYVEAKFVQLTEGTSRNLGIDWQSLSGYKVGVTPSATISTTIDRNKDNTSTGQRIYDMNGNEVPIFDHIETLADGTSITIYKPAMTRDSTGDRNVAGARSLSAVLNADQFSVVLSALEGNSGAKLVSNPKIIVANEQAATIKMAKDEPNVKITRSRATVQGQEDLITSELDTTHPYFTYGITLDVTPRVNTASNITVIVKPELSRWLKDKVAPDGNVFPIIEKKTVETTFTLGDGHTAAIGGLTETVDNDEDSSIPVLGRIPWIGPRLFSHKTRTHTQNEVLIFVTVGLVDPQSVTAENGFQKSMTLRDKKIVGKP